MTCPFKVVASRLLLFPSLSLSSRCLPCICGFPCHLAALTQPWRHQLTYMPREKSNHCDSCRNTKNIGSTASILSCHVSTKTHESKTHPLFQRVNARLQSPVISSLAEGILRQLPNHFTRWIFSFYSVFLDHTLTYGGIDSLFLRGCIEECL